MFAQQTRLNIQDFVSGPKLLNIHWKTSLSNIANTPKSTVDRYQKNPTSSSSAKFAEKQTSNLRLRLFITFTQGILKS